jgi:hypothetical protein
MLAIVAEEVIAPLPQSGPRTIHGVHTFIRDTPYSKRATCNKFGERHFLDEPPRIPDAPGVMNDAPAPHIDSMMPIAAAIDDHMSPRGELLSRNGPDAAHDRL